jgi:hypothetical protein
MTKLEYPDCSCEAVCNDCKVSLKEKLFCRACNGLGWLGDKILTCIFCGGWGKATPPREHFTESLSHQKEREDARAKPV